MPRQLPKAVSRPSMRFVPVKTGEQQAVLSLHRARQGFVKARTAQGNRSAGCWQNSASLLPQGIGSIVRRLPEILEDGENDLPGTFRHLLQRLGEHLKELERQVAELDAQIQRWHQATAASRKLAEIPGIGPLTASALVAAIGDTTSFENGRQFAGVAGLGAAAAFQRRKANPPRDRQAGDGYLRMCWSTARGRSSGRQGIPTRSGGQLAPSDWSDGGTRTWPRWRWRTSARIVWALLAHDRAFQADYAHAAA